MTPRTPGHSTPALAAAPSDADALTGRALVVLQLVARGYSTAQIDALFETAGATQDAIRRARVALGGELLAWVLAEAKRRGLVV